MARKRLEFPTGILDCIDVTRERGTILASAGPAGTNGMTIGWITIGFAWGRPCCVVLVRKSRHTCTVMEQAESFTVNVLPEKLQKAVDLFGEASGRDMDKFAAAKITPVKGETVDSPYVKEADLAIECKIAFKSRMDPSLISADYVRKCYGDDDYHTMYYGEITAIHRR